VKVALRNCGYNLRGQYITINWAPADVKKEGPAFDLPIAVGILEAAGCVRAHDLGRYPLMGEPSLDSLMRPVHLAPFRRGCSEPLSPRRPRSGDGAGPEAPLRKRSELQYVAVGVQAA
jgi:hypothetical protein